MKRSGRLLLLLALLVSFGGLLGCGQGGSPSGPQGGPQGEPQSVFTLDCGLMDVWDMKKTGPVHMVVSPDSKLLMTMSQSSKENVQVWDLNTRTRIHGIRNDIGTMNAPIAIAGDSKTAAYVQLRPIFGIVVLDLVTGKPIRTIHADNHISPSVRGLHFTPDGKRIVAGCKQEIVFWDTASGDLKGIWNEPTSVRALSPFFDNGKKIACLNGEGKINIWDVKAGKPAQSLSAGGDPQFVAALAVTPDQKTLISRANGPFKFWDLPGGNLRAEFKEQFGTYTHIVPLADNRTVAWATNNGFILYDLQTATKKQQIKANDIYVSALATTPDGSLLLTAATDSTIKAWKLSADGTVE